MALSRIKYPASGATSLFSVPFGYLAMEHVKVYLDGIQTTAFSWQGPTSILLDTAPPFGVTVDIRRETPNGARIVNFQDGSMLGEKDLDTDSDQLFYLTQEAYDSTGDTLTAGTGLDFDAHGKRIINVGDPEGPYDAVTQHSIGVMFPVISSVGEKLADIKLVAEDLANTGLSIQDYGTLDTPLDPLPSPQSKITQVAAVSAEVKSVGDNIASVTYVAAHLPEIIAALAAAAGGSVLADGQVTAPKLASSIDLGVLA